MDTKKIEKEVTEDNYDSIFKVIDDTNKQIRESRYAAQYINKIYKTKREIQELEQKRLSELGMQIYHTKF